MCFHLSSLKYPSNHSCQMPWQIAPALVIISAAFTLTGGAIYGIQYAAYGKVRNGISAMSVNSTSIFSFHSIGPPVLQSLTDRCFDVSLAPLQNCSDQECSSRQVRLFDGSAGQDECSSRKVIRRLQVNHRASEVESKNQIVHAFVYW